jgi:hypothetical protein
LEGKREVTLTHHIKGLSKFENVLKKRNFSFFLPKRSLKLEGKNAKTLEGKREIKLNLQSSFNLV